MPRRELMYCTLTGVDEHTSLSELWELRSRFPFAEFGVLFSRSRAGTGRYPGIEWIRRLAQILAADADAPQFALHVCGRAVHELLEDPFGTSEVATIAQHFPRIQLNLDARTTNIDQLRNHLRCNPNQTVVTQHNQANASLHSVLVEPNHAVLFDESGGRGISREAWPAVLRGKSCGYAGGLGPANIAQELPRIFQASGGAPFWIDAEGRLRDDEDRFSLTIASDYLDQVADCLAKLHPEHLDSELETLMQAPV